MGWNGVNDVESDYCTYFNKRLQSGKRRADTKSVELKSFHTFSTE